MEWKGLEGMEGNGMEWNEMDQGWNGAVRGSHAK